jgi:branched-chain amino acid transport system substrate-binding protein
MLSGVLKKRTARYWLRRCRRRATAQRYGLVKLIGRWRISSSFGGFEVFKTIGRLLVPVAIVSLLLSACGNTSGSTPGAPVKIGVLGPLSGPYAASGTEIVNTALLAVDDVNSHGGVSGHKLEVVSADDQCDAQVGAQAAQKLVNEGAVAFVGGYCSSATLAEMTILQRNGNLPYVAVASSNPLLVNSGWTDIFQIGQNDELDGPVMANYFTQVLNVHKLAILHDNTTYPLSLANYVKAAAIKLGITVVFFNALTPGQKDYSSVLTKVASTGAEALLYTGFYVEFSTLAIGWGRLKPSFRLVSNGTVDPQVRTVVGSVLNDPNLTVLTATLTEFLNDPAALAVKASYKAKFGIETGVNAAYEWDGIHYFAAALESTAGKTGAVDLNKALSQTKYVGLTGSVAVNANGARLSDAYLAVRGQGDPPQWQVIGKYVDNAWVSA